jgi:hypothetical protein
VDDCYAALRINRLSDALGWRGAKFVCRMLQSQQLNKLPMPSVTRLGSLPAETDI